MKILFILLIQFYFLVSKSVQNSQTIKKIYESFSTKSKKEQFKVWHLVNDKKYPLSSDIAKTRFKIFKQNLNEINEFNRKTKQFNRGIGPFIDLTQSEFESQFLIKNEYQNDSEVFNYIQQIDYSTEKFLNDFDDDELVESTSKFLNFEKIDFRYKLPPIKNQEKCGSCWAFTTITGLEGNFYDCNNFTETLSVQYLVDCDNSNHGCHGGKVLKALNFTNHQLGIPYESDYPYKFEKFECRKKNLNTEKLYKYQGSIVTCGELSNCAPNDFLDLVRNGIVMTRVNATEWVHYNGSIFYEENKSNGHNHAVSVVGAGFDAEKNSFYYLVRNQWGNQWGEMGYMKYAFTPNTHVPISKWGVQISSACKNNNQ